MAPTLTEITHPNRAVEVKLTDASRWVRGTEITVEHHERARGPYDPIRWTRHIVRVNGSEYTVDSDALRPTT